MDDFEAVWLAPVHRGVRLHFIGGSRDGEYVEIESSGVYSFGRDEEADFSFRDDNAVDAKVSREHALLKVSSRGVTLENRNPTNGLDLFDVEVDAGRVVALSDGDLVRLGRGGPRIGVRIGRLAELAEPR